MKTSKKAPSIVYWLGENVYINVTNKCSNSCYFCFRKFKKGIKDFNLKLEIEPTENEAIEELQKIIKRRNWNEIVFCGFGEPLERLDFVLKVTQWIKNHCQIPIRINTNGHGYLLNKGRDVIRELMEAGVIKLNVSLNANSKEKYNQICKPTYVDAYENVIKFIKMAKTTGLETQVTAVTIPEIEIIEVKNWQNKWELIFL